MLDKIKKIEDKLQNSSAKDCAVLCKKLYKIKSKIVNDK
jgi:hypothetical protein